jgi:L,D-transpeptidase YcbB
LSVRFAIAAATLTIASASLAASPVTPRWTPSDLRGLVEAIEEAPEDGLDPADYDLAALRAAIASRDALRIDASASAHFRHLAGDRWEGHVRGKRRIDWHIAGPVADAAALAELEATALTSGRVGATLDALLPTSPEYLRLKLALAKTPATDHATRTALRANMERWRWVPRDPGARYLLVNVAGYTAELVDSGAIVSMHRIVIGKPAKSTPQFSTVVEGVIINPWWELPKSIVAEGIGSLLVKNPARAKAQGYVRVRTPGGGTRVRQAPGPRNALGQMKLVMPNPYTVYLHDTPSKALFDQTARAFSHGCMRVDRPFDLATALLADTPGWNRARIDAALASGKTVKADLGARVPIFVVYFTVRAGADGSITKYPDVYGRDAVVVAALTDRETGDARP